MLDSVDYERGAVAELEPEVDTLVGGGGAVHLHQGLQQGVKLDRNELSPRQLGIEPRCARNFGNQAIYPANIVLENADEPEPLGLIVEDLDALDGAPQRGERILEFVCDVGRKRLDRIDTLIELYGHLVQRTREIADLVPPPREVGDRHPAGLAMLHPLGGLGEAANRPRDGAGEVEREQHGHAERQRRDAEDGQANRAHAGINIGRYWSAA